jgi:hypothetical protein
MGTRTLLDEGYSYWTVKDLALASGKSQTTIHKYFEIVAKEVSADVYQLDVTAKMPGPYGTAERFRTQQVRIAVKKGADLEVVRREFEGKNLRFKIQNMRMIKNKD